MIPTTNTNTCASAMSATVNEDDNGDDDDSDGGGGGGGNNNNNRKTSGKTSENMNDRHNKTKSKLIMTKKQHCDHFIF